MFYTNAINAINNIGQGIQPGAQWQSFSNWTGSFYPNQCGEYSGQCVAFPLSDTTTNKANLTIPPIPANGQPPAANYDPSYGASMQFYYPPAKDPRVQMYTFQIQRELPSNMLLSVGYVGNHGTHLAGEAWRQFNHWCRWRNEFSTRPNCLRMFPSATTSLDRKPHCCSRPGGAARHSPLVHAAALPVLWGTLLTNHV